MRSVFAGLFFFLCVCNTSFFIFIRRLKSKITPHIFSRGLGEKFAVGGGVPIFTCDTLTVFICRAVVPPSSRGAGAGDIKHLRQKALLPSSLFFFTNAYAHCSSLYESLDFSHVNFQSAVCFGCGEEKNVSKLLIFLINFCLLKPCHFKLRCFWCFKLSRACVSVFELSWAGPGMGLLLGQMFGAPGLWGWGCSDPEQLSTAMHSCASLDGSCK